MSAPSMSTMSNVQRTTPIRRFAPVLLGLGLLAGCASNATSHGDQTEMSGSLTQLRELQPADIAIAPIKNETGFDGAPTDRLRQALAGELIDRLYSPLALDYVDGNWVESSFLGTPPPDAVLVMTLTEWDASRVYSSGKVQVAAQLRIFEGGDTTGAPLWGLTLQRSIDMGDGRGNPPAPSESVISQVIQRFAAAALELLPERDPVAAHS
jgi:hypothetical protein